MSKLIIPLYSYPGSSWYSLIQTKQLYPSVDMVAVINPNSGPTASPISDYVNGVQVLHNAGIKAIGYVNTADGGIPLSTVGNQLKAYYFEYPTLDGIFFDNADSANTLYYSQCNYLAKSILNCGLTFGNAGAPMPELEGIFDELIEFENGYMPKEPVSSYIAYGIASLPAIPSARYLYVTDKTLPNPYNALPSYLEALAGVLANA